MKRIAFATLLIATSMATNALTLGKPRGPVMVGQPLTLTVPVQTSADEAGLPSCFEAEVFYGDLRQDPRRVSVTETTPSIEQPTRQLRIASTVPINEPVVTLWVLAGCQQQMKRRFVFLSEVETELDAVGSTVPLSSPKIVTASPNPLQQPIQAALEVKKSADVLGASPTKTNDLAPALPARPKLPTKQARRVRNDESISTALGAELGKRVDALAEWQALNLSPENMIKRSEQLRLLAIEMKALQESIQKNQTTLDEMSLRVDLTQTSQPNQYLLFFAALCSFSAAVAGFVLIRSKAVAFGGTPWWGSRSESLEDHPLKATGEARPASPLSPSAVNQTDYSAVEQAGPVQSKLPDISGSMRSDLDIDLDFGDLIDTVSSETYLESQPQGASQFLVHSSEKSVALTDIESPLNLREMMDVRQQAEFFMTLGQHDEAVGALVRAIEGDGSANPLVYIDLLTVLHALSRKTDFDRFRGEFNRLFSGMVPEYALFDQPGRTLELYNDVCEEIVRTWPSQKAIDYIEKQLIRSPHDEDTHQFDLEAYRDLLLLHGVLKRIVGDVESDFMSFSSPPTSEGSLFGGKERKVHAPLPAVTESTPPDGALTSPIELDFDLSEQETKPGPIQIEEGKSDNLIDFDLSNFPSVSVTVPKA